MLEKLPAELKAQQKNHAAVAARLRAQSDAWLRNTPGLRHFADTFVLHWCGAYAWFDDTAPISCAIAAEQLDSLGHD